MTSVKIAACWLYIISVAAIAVSAHASSVDTSLSPSDVLSKMLAKKVNRPCVLIQKMVHGRKLEAKVQVEIDDRGATRSTTLHPSRFRGTVSIDNGIKWQVVAPDSSWMIVRGSPGHQRTDLDKKLSLIERNYRLTFKAPCKIAGHDALVVNAQAKVKSMPARTFYVDKDSFILLRTELISKNGERRVLLDTETVRWQPKGKVRIKSMHPKLFRRVIDESCKGRSPVEVAKESGFEPRIPSTIPNGFEVQEMTVLRGSKTVAVRISDGLINGTVYQSIDDKENIQFRIEGDMPSDVQSRILNSFREVDQRNR